MVQEKMGENAKILSSKGKKGKNSPMFSVPMSRNDTTATMPGEAHPYTGHSVKGRKVSQRMRKRDVCLHGCNKPSFHTDSLGSDMYASHQPVCKDKARWTKDMWEGGVRDTPSRWTTGLTRKSPC
jgi:hypothetical protein